MKQVGKLLDLRELLIMQQLKSTLYTKTVVWKDLNINPGSSTDNDEIYANEKVVETYKTIDMYEKELKYLPSKEDFDEPTEHFQGSYTTLVSSTGETEISKYLDALIENNADMETLIKEKFLFSDEKIQNFLKTNPVQRTLREQVEELNRKVQMLEETIQRTQDRLSNEDKGQSEMNQLQKKYSDLQDKYSEQVQTTLTLESTKKGLDATLKEAQKKARAAEEKHTKMVNQFQPKLESAIAYQKSISEAFVKIKEDTELLPRIFRAEAADRNKVKAQQKQAEKEAQEALAIRNALQKEINDLKRERDRKKQLSIQAIAARSNIKMYLDQEKDKVSQLEHSLELIARQLKENEEEKLDYKDKHDEMFASVSALNSRIEELEQHKLHLLEKLKQYGDRGDLDYIVKTQGLDKIESKTFESRVQVEKYDPEGDRAANDRAKYEEHKRKKAAKAAAQEG